MDFEEWLDIGHDALAGAGACQRNRNWRSVVSRSYYAMFAATTGVLRGTGLAPPAARQTWSHKNLPRLVEQHLKPQFGGRAFDVKRMLSSGYKDRLVADYSSGLTVDEAVARRCLTNASSVLRMMGRR